MRKCLHILISAALFLPAVALASPDTSDPSSSLDSGSHWSNLTNAYADGGGAASTGVGTGNTSYATYYGFSTSIPTGATIDGIRMRHDAYFAGTTCGRRNHQTSLSWNGGTNWTSVKQITPTTSEVTYYLGGSTDTWGRTWSDTEVNSSTNFRYRVTCQRGTCIAPGISQHIDYIQREVYYTEPSGIHIGVLSVWTPALMTGALVEAMRHKVDISRGYLKQPEGE